MAAAPAAAAPAPAPCPATPAPATGDPAPEVKGGPTNYCECPEVVTIPDDEGTSLFLGGGISDCPDWQATVREALDKRGKCPGLLLYNPRRKHFDTKKEDELEKQIDWEAAMLSESTAILFWFPKETLCPITLYELGRWTMADKPIFVGAHPDYARRRDIVHQTKRNRKSDYPEIEVVDSLDKLVEQVEKWYAQLGEDDESCFTF